MSYLKNIGARLREERERLNASQTDFALLAAQHSVPGTTQRSVTGYETGAQSPSVSFLAVVATVGVDVNYVLTGERKTGYTTDAVLFVVNMVTNGNMSLEDALEHAQLISQKNLVYRETPHGNVPFVSDVVATKEQIEAATAEPKKRRGRPKKTSE